jgi:hypothetical protein
VFKVQVLEHVPLKLVVFLVFPYLSRLGLAIFNPQEGHIICNYSPEGRNLCIYIHIEKKNCFNVCFPPAHDTVTDT